MEPQPRSPWVLAGHEGAELELTEVVDFLKNRRSITAVWGPKIPMLWRLLPGTGKILSWQSRRRSRGSFFSISGSSSVEIRRVGGFQRGR